MRMRVVQGSKNKTLDKIRESYPRKWFLKSEKRLRGLEAGRCSPSLHAKSEWFGCGSLHCIASGCCMI